MQTQKPLYIFLHSWLFGPLAGGILVGLDYRKTGNKLWWLMAIAPTLMLLAVMFLLVYVFTDFAIPSYVLPAVYSGGYMYLQQLLVTEQKPTSFYSFWSGCGPAILGLLGTLILMLLLFLPGLLEFLNYATTGQLSLGEVIHLFWLGNN